MTRAVSLTFLIIMLIVGCTGQNPATQTEVLQLPKSTAPPEASQDVAEPMITKDESVPPATHTSTPVEAQKPQVAPGDDFRPSDPLAVSLAAGRPQFVEFFAFW